MDITCVYIYTHYSSYLAILVVYGEKWSTPMAIARSPITGRHFECFSEETGPDWPRISMKWEKPLIFPWISWGFPVNVPLNQSIDNLYWTYWTYVEMMDTTFPSDDYLIEIDTF